MVGGWEAMLPRSLIAPPPQVYYVFGFLFLVLLILVVTCAEISIVMAYFQLCSEDYNWWWRSFLTSGSSALYLFAYAIVYFT
jgi:transmembrane 9 superfamily protein 2/4